MIAGGLQLSIEYYVLIAYLCMKRKYRGTWLYMAYTRTFLDRYLAGVINSTVSSRLNCFKLTCTRQLLLNSFVPISGRTVDRETPDKEGQVTPTFSSRFSGQELLFQCTFFACINHVAVQFVNFS